MTIEKTAEVMGISVRHHQARVGGGQGVAVSRADRDAP